jgi:hypothetical protein
MAGTNKAQPANEVEALKLAKEKEHDRRDEKVNRGNAMMQTLARDYELRLRGLELAAQRAQAMSQMATLTEKLFSVWMITSLPPEGRQLFSQLVSAPPAAPLVHAAPPAHAAPPSLAALLPQVMIPTAVYPSQANN